MRTINAHPSKQAVWTTFTHTSDLSKQILRTWQEQDRTWVGWSQEFRVRVTRDVLVRFPQATIRLQIWNRKEQMSGLARTERLKSFRLAQLQREDAADVRGEDQF